MRPILVFHSRAHPGWELWASGDGSPLLRKQSAVYRSPQPEDKGREGFLADCERYLGRMGAIPRWPGGLAQDIKVRAVEAAATIWRWGVAAYGPSTEVKQYGLGADHAND